MSNAGRIALSLRLLVILCVALLCLGCERTVSEPKGALAGLLPIAVQGVQHAERLSDGRISEPGSAWLSDHTAVFASLDSYVDFDLGAEKPIVAVALIADNNDSYEVLGSTDAKTFGSIWTAPRHGGPGLRFRHVSGLNAHARYIRLKPASGDASLSIAEVSLFSEAPAQLPPRLETVRATDVALKLRSALLVAGTVLAFASLFMVAGGARSLQIVLGLSALTGLACLGWAMYEAYPIQRLEVSLARGVAAGVALVVVLRGAFAPDRYPPVRWFQVTVLGLMAALSIGAFYNLGTPQFYDHKAREPSNVHNYDMRVYFPVAKYFKELKYDGLYLASVLSYAEDHGGVDKPEIQRIELRDLKNHRMRRVQDIQPEVESVRERFSDARWAEFKTDMKYFWETMGPSGYLRSMADHGANATPVWLSVAYFMFSDVKASNEVFIWTGLVDPLLLLIFAIVAFRTFGPSTAFVSLIVFGANDFYMFGSNWAGATLRHDWMVYLGLGVCACKTERYRLGGALLALSALIRAFPAITLLALAVPIAHFVGNHLIRLQRLPQWKDILKNYRWFFQAAFGSGVCIVVCVVGSSVVMGLDSWPLWIEKISNFTASPHANHVSLLTVIAGSEGRQHEVLQQRAVVYLAAMVVYFGLSIWIGARSRPHQVALLGLLMVPVMMYPANYYMHFIFLLPLLVEDPAGITDRFARETAGKTWALLLLICTAQYFTVRERDLAMHFYNASVILMAGLLMLLWVLLPRDSTGRVDFDSLPFLHK